MQKILLGIKIQLLIFFLLSFLNFYIQQVDWYKPHFLLNLMFHCSLQIVFWPMKEDTRSLIFFFKLSGRKTGRGDTLSKKANNVEEVRCLCLLPSRCQRTFTFARFFVCVALKLSSCIRWTQHDYGHTLLCLSLLHIRLPAYKWKPGCSFKCSTGCALWTSYLKKYSFPHSGFSTSFVWLCRISVVEEWREIRRKLNIGETVSIWSGPGVPIG